MSKTQSNGSNGTNGNAPPPATAAASPPTSAPAPAAGDDNGQAGGGSADPWLSGGSFGVGLVLVAMPATGLFFGASYLRDVSMVGLPLMAIFGIMILFGSLSLVAMLFRRLGLTDTRQPLALPEGSIRAAIALALVVLFAVIAIMLFHTTPGVPFEVTGLTSAQRTELLAKASDRVVSVTDAACATPQTQPCADADRRYNVRMRAANAPATDDLAKQLLVLIGTLMTSLTSFYFAARSTADDTSGGRPAAPGGTTAPAPGAGTAPATDPAGRQTAGNPAGAAT